MAAAAHKFHGPKGIGFVFIRKATGLQSLLFGGGQERGLRAGTESVHNIVGLGEAFSHAYSNLDADKSQITDLKMYCIDSWTEHNDDPEYDWQFNKKPKWKDDKLTLHDLKENEKWNHAKNEQHFRENAEQWKDRITIFKGKSMDFLDQIPDKSLDFVFHDSDHSYPFVLNEIPFFL